MRHHADSPLILRVVATMLATAGLGLAGLVSPLVAAAPKVVKLTPANGDQAVDPGTRELVIEFDQDMRRDGHSLCGGGENFPEIKPAQGARGPRWKSARVFVVPVRLKPNHTYELSINCPKFQNFRGATGESAEATPFGFKTAAAKAGASKPQAPADAFDPQPLVAALREAIEKNYSHRELHRVDWDQRFAEFAPKLTAAKSGVEFARVAAELLSATKDMHVFLTAGDQRFAATGRKIDANLNPAALRKQVQQLKEHKPAIVTGQLAGGIGYLLVNSLPADTGAMQPALEAIAAWQQAPAIVVDLRLNAGGDERAGRLLAGCFVSKQTPYAKHRTIAPDAPGGWLPEQLRSFDPTPKVQRYKGRVAVLMGPKCMSSCESLLLMFRAISGVRLFGEQSYGSTGNPRPTELDDEVTVYLPSWIDMQLDGTPIEGRGIAPDEVVKFGAAANRDSDPVLDAALTWLRQPAASGN
ncbi:MAG: hypothetical protein K1X74_21865 [Pirellulales bacterium]|nr:hypothetical protein [Pirellulales bacterium]